MLLLPTLVPSMFLTLWFVSISTRQFKVADSVLIPIVVLGLFAAVVSYMLVGATYPILVRSTLTGAELPLTEAFRLAFRRFLTVFIASILVIVVTISGFILLVVPGIIFTLWYFYTIPSIMLDGKGAIGAMSASKAFGRENKGKTFLILLIAFAVSTIISSLGLAYYLVGIPTEFIVVLTLLAEAVVTAWACIIPSYAYLTYGPPSDNSSAIGNNLENNSNL